MALSGHSALLHRPTFGPHRVAATHAHTWWHELLWVAAAAAVGFGLTAITAGVLELARPWIVLAHAAVTLPLAAAYVRWSGIDVPGLVRRHWKLGVLGGVVVGALVVMAVLAEDATARPEGLRLVWDLAWLGVAYGFLDALLLTVLPVVATWRAFEQRGWADHWRGMVAAGVVAVGASLLVTAAYHLGYPEFRNSDLSGPLFGNTLMTVGYVMTNNPLTAFISHIAMHVAAVWQGAEGVQQLPPHY
jgi:hypothetical protein